MDEVVALVRDSTGVQIVEAAHMELAPPTLSDAFAACVKQGATHVAIHPYFLAPGRHSTASSIFFAMARSCFISGSDSIAVS